MISNKTFNVLRVWIPLAIVTTLFALLIYWGIQQNIRLSANDPQIQIAQDGANYLKNGGQVNLAQNNQVEISKSLATYLMIFDQNKKLISYSGVLNGKPAVIPSGVFDYAKKNDEDKFTWQPEIGVRSAVVVNYYNNGKTSGYILVGRSMKEIEKREDLLLKGVFATWIFALILSFISIAFFESSLAKNLKTQST